MDLNADPASRQQQLHAYALALVTSGVAAAAQWLLPVDWDARVGLALFCPAVALAGWRGGFGPAALATLLGALVAGRADAAGLLFVAGGLGLALAVEAVRRQERRERDSRYEAEHRRRQAERLHDFTTELSRAATPVEVIDACVLEATHSLEAAAGALALVSDDGSSAELAKTVGFREPLVDAWRRVPLDLKTPFSDAIHLGATIALGSRTARNAKYAELVDQDFFDDYEAVVTVPLVGRGGAVGALALALSDAREWTPAECEFLLQASRRAVRALERARAYELAERARADAEDLRVRAGQELAERQKAEKALRDSEARYRSLAARTSRLHALTAALSEAVTLDAVGRAVVRHGRVVVGAQSGAVTLLVEAGSQLSSLCAEDDDSPQVPEAWSRFAVEPGLYSTEVVQQRRPVFIGSFADWQRRYWRSAPQAADGGYASAAALPLVSDGAPIGVLSFHFTAPLNFDEDYRTLLTSVAQHCAQALDRARLYEAEQRARADAEAANRSKDDFLSTVSHELRTPLNAILGWASMLRAGSLGADRTTRALQAIYDNATRQARLIDELLDVSRIVAGRVPLDLRESDLREIIRGAVEAMMPQAEAKRLEMQLGPSPPVFVVADARRLEQVFLNLLSNAVKFTPAGGRVEVDVAVTDTAIDVRVSDTGIGMDPSFVPHAFDQFRQADSQTTRVHGGLGLGLSIARRLVEAHGGRIRLDSEGPGRGTSCTVSLPIAALRVGEAQLTPAASAAPPAGVDDLPDLSSVRILVVDDEPDAREMTSAALERCGATVVVAASAEEALAVLGRTDVDVLLADIGMPGEDGYSLMRKVRALTATRTAAVPAAAVTAYAREDQRHEALAAGFQVHLAKPLDPYRLAHTVVKLARTAV